MILAHKRYKIALVGFRLSRGGAEKVMAMLSFFFESKGIEIHNIIVLDSVTYPFAGKLLNLGKLKNKSNGPFNKWIRYWELKKYLDQHNFDFIIDFRFRTKPLQELLIAKWLYNSKVIFSVRSYLIDHYMPNATFLTRLMYGNSEAIVAVTERAKQRIETQHGLTNVTTIHNPIDLEYISIKKDEPLNIEYDFILGVGQMASPIKQFDKLIKAYSDTILPKNNIRLVLLGDGALMPELKKLAAQLQIAEKVHFLGHQENPFSYMKKARFLVLSSANEGMPNVLLQALACETPVVAFDCLSGPSEIIRDKENGLLVEDQNVAKLTEAMNLFVNDEALYQFCKRNALESLKPFSIEKIGQQWLDLMQIKIRNDDN